MTELALNVINGLKNKNLVGTSLVTAVIDERQDSSSRKLRTGKLFFHKDFSGIKLAALLDRALRSAALPPEGVMIDWDMDRLVYPYRGDRGIWSMSNWTDDPARRAERTEIGFNDVLLSDMNVVFHYLLSVVEMESDRLMSAPLLLPVERAPHSQQQEQAHYTSEAHKQAELG